MKAGVYTNLNIDDYHSDPALGSSGLKEFMDCPYMYFYRYIEGQRENKKSFGLGKLAHEFILENDKFNHVIFEGKIRRGKEWEEINEHASSVGSYVLKPEEFKELEAMRAEVLGHKQAAQLCSGGRAEVSFFAVDKQTGVMIKARPDYIVKLPGIGNCIVDYKTTSAKLSTRIQSGEAFKYDRHIQAAFHKNVVELATGSKIERIIYITQMTSAPYLVRIFAIDEEQINEGKMEIEAYMGGFKKCLNDRVWPKYSNCIESYTTPAWFQYRYFELNNNILEGE